MSGENGERRNFEEALERLEAIVAQMESGEASLDEMLAMFEEGQRLLKSCTQKLNEVEKRIEKITANGGGLKVETLELKAEL